jgi:uncharacterized protein YodC (DUF2158 family)
VLKLGDKVKDTVTGTKGILTARAEYLSGSPQLMLEWFDGTSHHQRWFDESRIVTDPDAE